MSDIVRKQLDLGIDIINDGEHSKFNFITYGRMRLGGLGPNPNPVPMMGKSRNSLAFPQTYAEMASMNAARSPEVAARRTMPTQSTISIAPITYVGQAEVARDIANLKDAVQSEAARGKKPADLFMTAISPNNLEFYHRNGYYKTDDEHLEAIANAMNVEYRAIVDAGFVLQIDDPRMATHYNRTPDASIEDCRKFIARRVEVVNLALKGIPRDRVRFHTCYSVNVAPRVHDMELRHYIDLMLRINAQAFSFEAANPRHDHEWAVWKETQAARRHHPHPRCRVALRAPGRAPRARRAADRALCEHRRPRERARQQRLRLRDIGGRRRGQHRGGVGEARGPGGGRADRVGAAMAAQRRRLRCQAGGVTVNLRAI